MVRAVGVEPTLLSEPDFESGASTNSTTPALAAYLAVAARDAKPRRRANPDTVCHAPDAVQQTLSAKLTVLIDGDPS
jgi:hypothetical protein